MFDNLWTKVKENWKKTTAGLLIVGGAITGSIWGTPDWVKVAINAIGGIFGASN